MLTIEEQPLTVTQANVNRLTENNRTLWRDNKHLRQEIERLKIEHFGQLEKQGRIISRLKHQNDRLIRHNDYLETQLALDEFDK